MNQVMQRQREELQAEEFHSILDLHDLHLQLGIQDSCSDAYLKTAARWAEQSDLLTSCRYSQTFSDLLRPEDQLITVSPPSALNLQLGQQPEGLHCHPAR